MRLFPKGQGLLLRVVVGRDTLRFIVVASPVHKAVVYHTAHRKRLPQLRFLCRCRIDAVFDGKGVHLRFFWFSIYCLRIESGAPPRVEQNTLFFHNVGSCDFKWGNSWRSSREERPFTSRTQVATPYCGSTAQRICSWSSITSISRISEQASSATPRMISLSRSSIGGVALYLEDFRNRGWPNPIPFGTD